MKVLLEFGFYVCCEVGICWVKSPCLSKWVFFMGNVQFEVVGCISYFFSNKKSVLVIGDLVRA